MSDLIDRQFKKPVRAEKRLKPCPFCGGEACVQRHEFIGYTDTFGVVCLDCCAETRQFFTDKKTAERAWNRRAKNERE